MIQNQDKMIQSFARAKEGRPEYAPLLALYSVIYAYEGENGECGIYFAPNRVEKKQAAPHISPDMLRVDDQLARRFLLGVTRILLKEGKDGKEEIERLETALQGDDLPLSTLMAGCLRHDRKALKQAAEKIGVSYPLLEFVLEIPLKRALRAFAAATSAEFEDWSENFCPICGSPPGMAEFRGEEGKKHLFCPSCSTTWVFKRLKCPFCNTENTDHLSYFTGDGAVRVDTCGGCNHYLKTRDARRGQSDLPLEVEDLLTLHLDLAAVKEGFRKG